MFFCTHLLSLWEVEAAIYSWKIYLCLQFYANWGIPRYLIFIILFTFLLFDYELLLMFLYLCQHGGASVPILEISGNKGIVQLNGKTMEPNANVVLTAGDEIVFGSSGKYSYVSFWAVFPLSLMSWLWYLFWLLQLITWDLYNIAFYGRKNSLMFADFWSTCSWEINCPTITFFN